MIKYHQDRIDFASLHQNNIDRIQLEMIPVKSHVLEIGCATGYMTEYLSRDKQCHVLGIEPVQEQAELARKRGLEVITGLIDSRETQEQLIAHTKEHGLFETIFMSQVIEHIADPATTLRALKNLLTPDGYLVISTCSIVHWKCRLQILFGKWEYEDYGIFDRTHLRFFTIKSFRQLLEESGYTVVDFGYTFEDICPFKILFDTRILAPSDLLRLIPFIGIRLRRVYTDLFKNFLATQFVYKAQPIQDLK
ncbi:MAG: class I SAM-dependent methyltransferase [Proteobacteria bacterium]|jgi:methionine biosynthesis protein MetW|nr:class I SAM-dependent methyltransferase [Desulfocapsa sp.]MBU3944441.1 class I SAM-dependent methyltransferase [Pseudomonadota bacterium]MBU4028730.1 class I SAM-dependent methyltransferase [Pseudomonadota bacterium]MBU4042218.1 class I SAM-dependent methyltransferase [Pseudomonadota bacterium]MBU4084086.1 class I SAM-dependent methyltransferase [Pseudomonadota bacterium]